MKIINLTPHSVSVCDAAGLVLVTLPPSGQVARVSVTTSPAGDVNGLPLVRQVTGAVTGLPPVEADTMLVVSAMVRLAAPARLDLASPGELVRGADGQPVGCKGLVVNGGGL